jgi:hypothetical protein
MPRRWLRRRIEHGKEVIRVVDVERRAERPATPAEIETGVFLQGLRPLRQGGCSSMTTQQQPTNANTAPKDQVTETRRVLKEMMDKANRAIDDQTGRRPEK